MIARQSSGGRPTAEVTAKTSLGASTKYEVVVAGLSYGRCVKKWEDFSDLYDSLHLRYVDALVCKPHTRTRTRTRTRTHTHTHTHTHRAPSRSHFTPPPRRTG
jgi:hypothetical protein